jgi:hypothetical protein
MEVWEKERHNQEVEDGLHYCPQKNSHEGMIVFFFFSFIHMCIQCLGHFSLLPPSPSLPPIPSLSPLPSLLPDRNYFALISDFVEKRV